MTNIQEEIWKDIPNYEGLYQASNLGRIKSLKWCKERILKDALNDKGYKIVVLCKGKPCTKTTSRLVISAFLGIDSRQVDHINGIKTDNRLLNLRYVSPRENVQYHHIKNKNKTSKFVGVSWRKNEQKWRACICINGKDFSLGYFNSEIEASFAYRKKIFEITQ
jgi:hypothetical protein